ncbi:hypothetical protein PR048_026837 [Dryococelus australis]|uniref:Uncharacterized protein n=1 Tax=Dryococelus australis TaxID=614101 RepID=A0ABQ9GMH9_9NEOP|nr:hypothetical protein PR048_026837 [Dryococelus australis]
MIVWLRIRYFAEVEESEADQFHLKASNDTVLLATNVVEGQDTLDLGSQANFTSEKAMLYLGLTCRKTIVPLQGIFKYHSVWHKELSCVLKPHGKEGQCFSADMPVLPHLTGHIPSTPFYQMRRQPARQKGINVKLYLLKTMIDLKQGDLGESCDLVLCRLHSIKCNFKRQQEVKKQYVGFLQDYLATGHMRCIETND